ncbi:MAG: hypothetical protein JWN01_605 [Patescibacteria group bacterium]|nr:hypothetical protein [Patescibacteria group bacterium]
MNGRSVSIARSMAVIGGTGALIVAATFAAFTTNAVSINGTTLAVEDSSDFLRIYDFAGANFATSTANPANAGNINLTLHQGVESAKQHFYLQNTSTDTDIGISVKAAGVTGTIDHTKVKVRFYDDAASPHLLGSDTLANLESTGVALNTGEGKLPFNTQGDSSSLGTDHNGNYLVSFELTGSGENGHTLSDVNLLFTGTSL